MKNADRRVLHALHDAALDLMSDREWLAVIGEVEKAGGVLSVDGYARTALQKAAVHKQSFNGNRSAAGAYAASVRWGKGGGRKVSDGAVPTSNPAGAGEAMNMGLILDQHSTAIAAVGKDSAAGKALQSAYKDLGESRKADLEGRAFDAWNSASSAEFAVRPFAQARGAKPALKKYHGMLEQLVLDMTDAYYTEREAA